MSQAQLPKDALRRMQQASAITCRLMMSANTTFLGAGTTGSMILLTLFRRLATTTEGFLPQITRWGTFDADGDSRDPDSLLQHTNVRFTPLGQDGAGTVLNNGLELAKEHSSEIQSVVLELMSEQMKARDRRFATNLPAAECQTVVIIGGHGGTSGPMSDALITAAHLAARDLGLRRLDTVLIVVGPEMPWRDVQRCVDPERIQRLLANYGECALWRYQAMATHHPVTIDVAGQGKIRMPAASRVASYLEFDWASETTKLATVEELAEMMAASLFHRFFTAAGGRRASRECDDVICGRTGQRHPVKK